MFRSAALQLALDPSPSQARRRACSCRGTRRSWLRFRWRAPVRRPSRFSPAERIARERSALRAHLRDKQLRKKW
eukprot:4482232-Heterocapsa_arctica.AAC.1